MMALPALAALLPAGTAAAGTLGAISTGLSIAGAVAGAVSDNNQASYQAAVAKNNEQVALHNAQEATLNAQKEGQQKGLFAAVELGDLLATQSASGLNLGSGSFALARKSRATLASKDSEIIANDGAARSRNFLDDAATYGSEAAQAEAAGSFSLLTGGLGIATSAISGASKSLKLKTK